MQVLLAIVLGSLVVAFILAIPLVFIAICLLSGRDKGNSTTPPNKDIWGAAGELPPRSPNKNIWG